MPLIVAHRGASYAYPENTMPSFLAAWQEDADAIEGDFHLTGDGNIVCIHDRDTSRVCGSAVDVRTASLSQLKGLDAGKWRGSKFTGTAIPTIGEVLSAVPPGKKIFIEIKSGPDIIDQLLETATKSPLFPGSMVFISFDTQVIADLKTVAPACVAYLLADIKKSFLGELSPSADSALKMLSDIKANGLSTNHNNTTKEYVQRILGAGYEHHVWTVDSADTARDFAAWGTSSITTNRPGYIRDALRK